MPYTFPVPETPENANRYRYDRLVQVERRDGTTFIGRVTRVDTGKPGGVMLVTCEDANAKTA